MDNTARTSTLSLPEVDLVYDVRGAAPSTDGPRPLVIIGQPMCADGFEALAEQITDRPVITYDPRGLGRSTTRRDGRDDLRPQDQAADLHALVAELGAGPVDVLGSSGGAVAGLEWAASYPDDIATLVAHEPPSLWALTDADAAGRAFERVRESYQQRGFGAGFADFVGLISWPGEFTDAYFETPPADPAAMGMPSEDDGSRDDPLLSERSSTVVTHQPDLDTLRSGSTRVILGIGAETGDAITARTARGVAAAIDAQIVEFPGGHGGFAAAEGPMPGQPEAFAQTLLATIDDA